MKRFFTLSIISLIFMVIIDFAIGPKAEFINAFSVLERFVGRSPSAGESLVAGKIGPWGELGVVLLVNLAIGGILAGLSRRLSKQ